jgi:serine acetyltransferase
MSTAKDTRGSLTAILRADIQRNRGNWISLLTLAVFRTSHYLDARASPLWLPVRMAHRVVEVLWTELIIGAELPGPVEIGPGLRLPHGGRGVILHANTRIGANATIYHRVTIGVRGTPDQAPTLGDNVYLGAGASVLGDIEIGSDVKVGAGAVVVANVPSGTTVVSQPARLMPA